MSRAKPVLFAIAAVALFFGGNLYAGADDELDDDTSSGGEASRAAIGPVISESSFVKITPCRIVDTRGGGGGRVSPNQTRNYMARGALSGQGGASNCGIPSSADSIAGNITAVDPGGNGFIRVKAFNGSASLPTGTVVNYGTVGVTNGTPIPLCEIGCGSSHFTIGAFGHSTDIVIDVTGYTVPPIHAVINFQNIDGVPTMIIDSAKRVSNVTRQAVGLYTVSVSDGTDIRGCTITGSGGSTSGDSSVPVTLTFRTAVATSFIVEVSNSAGALRDDDFMVVVHC